MDKNQILLFVLSIFIFMFIYKSYERFPYGNYTRSETLGRLIPR